MHCCSRPDMICMVAVGHTPLYNSPGLRVVLSKAPWIPGLGAPMAPALPSPRFLIKPDLPFGSPLLLPSSLLLLLSYSLLLLSSFTITPTIITTVCDTRLVPADSFTQDPVLNTCVSLLLPFLAGIWMRLHPWSPSLCSLSQPMAGTWNQRNHPSPALFPCLESQ